MQYFGNASLTYQAKAVSKEETDNITPDKLSRISNNCFFSNSIIQSNVTHNRADI